MPDNPNPHDRQSIRLPGFDYAQGGAYFVTICAWNRKCLFGRIVVGAQHAVPLLTPLGHIAQQCWAEIPAHFPDFELDAFVVMPNHVQLTFPGMLSGSGGLSPDPFPPLFVPTNPLLLFVSAKAAGP